MISCRRGQMPYHTSSPGVSLALLSVVLEGWNACSFTTPDDEEARLALVAGYGW